MLMNLTKYPPSPEKIAKSTLFGLARGLTTTAQEGQAAVVGALRGKFTLRNKWFEQQSPLGIKKKPATAADPSAEIWTAAYFLPLQETGGPKVPYKHWLAIPIVPFAKPSKNALIPKQNLPANLKNAFVLTTKSGKEILCIRRLMGRAQGRGAVSSLPMFGGRQTPGLVTMYMLVKKAQVKKADIWLEPITKVVERRLHSNVEASIQAALNDIT